MDLFLTRGLAENYKSSTQKARILTEEWFSRSIYCPNCEAASLSAFPNNQEVADFHCVKCHEQFELKSSRRVGRKIADGSYASMCHRITSNTPPTFCFLRYDDHNSEVRDFFVIPSFFFTTEVIEKRSPLPPSARRAGWIGCNILLDRIPPSGKLFYVHDRVIAPMSQVRSGWSRMLALRAENPRDKGWLLQVLRCVEEMPYPQFSLVDVYAYEDRLKEIYPGNNNIRPKIRQQLQRLREKGYVRFLGNGNYQRCDPPGKS